MATRGLIALLALAMGGCAASPTMHAAADAPVDVRIEWIGHTVLQFDDERLGGLSGLTFAEGRWFAVTDHPREPRLVELAIHVDAAAQAVDAELVDWTAIDAGATDAEAVQWLGEDRFVVGFEAPGALAIIGRDGARQSNLVIESVIERGLRPNRRFEALAVRDRDELWAGVETALEHDGSEASVTAGALCRVIVFALGNGGTRQHVYTTQKAPGVLPGASFNSLVDFASLGDGRLLALERRLDAFAGYGVALRLITPDRGETDVSPIESLRDAVFTPLRVETIADFGALQSLGPGNVEGMAIGPAIDDERAGRLLVLVSDDNFGREGERGALIIALRLVTSSDAGRAPSAPR